MSLVSNTFYTFDARLIQCIRYALYSVNLKIERNSSFCKSWKLVIEDDGNRKYLIVTVKKEIKPWGDDNGIDKDTITDMIYQLYNDITVKVFCAKYKVKERQYNDDNTSIFNDKERTDNFRKELLVKSNDSNVNEQSSKSIR